MSRRRHLARYRLERLDEDLGSAFEVFVDRLIAGFTGMMVDELRGIRRVRRPAPRAAPPPATPPPAPSRYGRVIDVPFREVSDEPTPKR